MFSDLFEERKESPIELEPNGMSIDLLRAVYRSSSIPLPTRLRAAIAALPHETPRLQVTAQVNEQSFAELLDRRLKRIAEMKNGNTQVIESSQVIEPTDIRPPHPITNDRRFRRL